MLHTSLKGVILRISVFQYKSPGIYDSWNNDAEETVEEQKEGDVVFWRKIEEEEEK